MIANVISRVLLVVKLSEPIVNLFLVSGDEHHRNPISLGQAGDKAKPLRLCPVKQTNLLQVIFDGRKPGDYAIQLVRRLNHQPIMMHISRPLGEVRFPFIGPTGIVDGVSGILRPTPDNGSLLTTCDGHVGSPCRNPRES